MTRFVHSPDKILPMLIIIQMLVGRAGYLAGALWLRSEGVEALSDSEMRGLCDVMLTCGQVIIPSLVNQDPRSGDLNALFSLARNTARGPGPRAP